MVETINLVLADGQALVLAGLRRLFEAEVGMRVLATATDGERLLDAVRRFRPDVVVIERQMSYRSGLDCLRVIRGWGLPTRVVIMTADSDGATLRSILAAGADGLLLKTDPPDHAVAAVRQVMAGQLVFPAAARCLLKETVVTPSDPVLTARELAVLALVAEGLSNNQIADRLGITLNAVKFHLHNVYQQLHVANRTEASRWYLRHAHPIG